MVSTFYPYMGNIWLNIPLCFALYVHYSVLHTWYIASVPMEFVVISSFMQHKIQTADIYTLFRTVKETCGSFDSRITRASLRQTLTPNWIWMYWRTQPLLGNDALKTFSKLRPILHVVMLVNKGQSHLLISRQCSMKNICTYAYGMQW